MNQKLIIIEPLPLPKSDPTFASAMESMSRQVMAACGIPPIVNYNAREPKRDLYGMSPLCSCIDLYLKGILGRLS